MRFGDSKGYKKPEESAGGSGGNGERWVKGFKDGETTIRLLDQAEEWKGYWEHYDASLNGKGAYFPCTGDRDSCPGCTSEVERTSKASKRYLANALVGRYVDVYKLPASVADKLVTRAVRDEGDVTLRPYTVIRSGKAPNIDYDVEREEKEPIDIARYAESIQDLDEALVGMWKNAFGDLDPEDLVSKPRKREEEEPKPRRQRPKTADEVEDEIREQKKAEKAERPDLTDTNPPSEPQQEQAKAAEGDDGETELTEEQLRGMSPEEIKSLIQQCGFEIPDSDDSDALADFLMEKLGA